MRKWIAGLLIWTMVFGMAAAFAEPDGDMREFAFQERVEGFCDRSECALRASYALTPRADADAAIVEAYGGYAQIRLFEFGCPALGPIVTSSFVCVGMDADGGMAILPTPLDLVARVYDPERIAAGLEIVLEQEG